MEWLRNWVTTVLGGIAGSALVLAGIEKHDWWLIIGGIALALAGAAAKDARRGG